MGLATNKIQNYLKPSVKKGSFRYKDSVRHLFFFSKLAHRSIRRRWFRTVNCLIPTTWTIHIVSSNELPNSGNARFFIPGYIWRKMAGGGLGAMPQYSSSKACIFRYRGIADWTPGLRGFQSKSWLLGFHGLVWTEFPLRCIVPVKAALEISTSHSGQKTSALSLRTYNFTGVMMTDLCGSYRGFCGSVLTWSFLQPRWNLTETLEDNSF